MNLTHVKQTTNYSYKQPTTLLTHGTNAKTVKSDKLGYQTFILYMSPARQWFGEGHELNSKNLCPMATKGCEAACLFTAGRGKFSNVMIGRKRKSEFYLRDRKTFMTQLHKEIGKAVKKYGDAAVFRLNGTTDIQWENIKYEGKSLMEHYPNNQFYDYTKIGNRFDKKLPSNYYLVYSYAETELNQKIAWELLAKGHSVAAVFAVKNESELPMEYNGYKVVNGDAHDATFIHPRGSIIGLKAKGDSVHDTTGFVIRNWNV